MKHKGNPIKFNRKHTLKRYLKFRAAIQRLEKRFLEDIEEFKDRLERF